MDLETQDKTARAESFLVMEQQAKGFVPDYHAVYVIYDKIMGWFSEMDSHRILWCSSLQGAKKFDTLRTVVARVDAMDMAKYIRETFGWREAVTRCYRRTYIFPGDYEGKTVADKA